MPTITITFQPEALQALEQALDEQRIRLQAEFGSQIPPTVPTDLQSWLSSVLEQAIAAIIAGRVRTPESESARQTLERAQLTFRKAVSGIQSITVHKEPT